MPVDLKRFLLSVAGTILTAAWSCGLVRGQEKAPPAPTPVAVQALGEETVDTADDTKAADKKEVADDEAPDEEASDESADNDKNRKDPKANLKRDCPPLTELGYRTKLMTEISLDITSKADELPSDCSADLFSGGEHSGIVPADRVVFWRASELYHQPLYWEQTRVERYGQSYGPVLQPILSGAHFLCTFPIIPYKIGLDRPCDRVYTLGYFRPGSCTPCVRPRLPWEWDAAFFEAGTLTGAILLLP